jgi:MFS transporter, DHA1 family, multidrug resistance protein
MTTARRCILLLSVVAFFVMMGSTIISPVLPLYALTFDVSMAMVGGLISGFGVSRLLMDIPSGIIASKVGMKRFMLIGVGIVAIGALTSGSAMSYWMLMAGRFIEGIGSAIYSTTAYTCVGLNAPREERGKYMSFYLGLLLLGTVSGPAIGGLVADLLGLRAPFYLYAASALFSFLLIWLGISGTLREAMDYDRKRFCLSDLFTLLKNYTLLSINLSAFSIFFVRIGVIATLLPIFGAFNLGLNELTIGLLLTVSALFNFFTMLIAGPLTDRLGRKPFMLISLLLTGVFVMLIPLAWDAVSLMAVMIGLGLALGLSGPIMAWITDVTEENQLGTAMGLFRTMSDAGFVVGPISLTLLAGATGQPLDSIPFVFASFIIIASGMMILRGRDVGRERF